MDHEPQSGLYRVCRRLLRPLVALLLKNGVMYRDFASWVKEAYVSVAAQDYGRGGRPTNQSRIALLTGLDRKEVKRLRDLAAAGQASDYDVRPGRLGRVLSGWFQDSDFATDGAPRPLADEDFGRLCARYGGDVPHSAILRELLDSGSVARDGHSRLVATSRYYMLDRTDAGALTRSADVWRDLGETLLHNLYHDDDEPTRFEGRATNLNVGVSAVPEFRGFLERRGEAFLEEVDAWLSDREANTPDNEDRLRLGLGMYWLQGASEDKHD